MPLGSLKSILSPLEHSENATILKVDKRWKGLKNETIKAKSRTPSLLKHGTEVIQTVPKI